MAEVQTAPVPALPKLPDGQAHQRVQPAGGFAFGISPEADTVIRGLQNGFCADRKSIARAGMEVGLDWKELASLGGALMYHMDSGDKNTKLEAARALFRILENNTPFADDKQSTAVYSSLRADMWKKVFNAERDETFLALPEITTVAQSALNTIHLKELNSRLERDLTSGKSERAPDAKTEIRARWDELKKEILD